MKRLTKAERRAEVERLLGTELVEKHRDAVEYGVKLRLPPDVIEKCILGFAAAEARPFRDPGGADIRGLGWSIEDDWGISFLYRGERLGTRFTSPKRDQLAEELRDLAKAATEAANALNGIQTDEVCWHCFDVLAGPPPKPRCERCPEECDDANCEAPGCEERVREDEAGEK